MSPRQDYRPARVRDSATIEVMAYDVLAPEDELGPNHAFLVITDNASGKKWIVRGGPSRRDPAEFYGAVRAGDLNVVGEVEPIDKSIEPDMRGSAWKEGSSGACGPACATT